MNVWKKFRRALRQNRPCVQEVEDRPVPDEKKPIYPFTGLLRSSTHHSLYKYPNIIYNTVLDIFVGVYYFHVIGPTAGKGPLPEGEEHADGFRSSHMFRGLIPKLEGAFHVAPDCIGFGYTAFHRA